MLLTDKEIRSYVNRGLLVRDMIDQDIQIQQAGVDLTVAKIFSLEGEGALDFTNEKRKLPKYAEIHPDADHWFLEPGTYHIAFNEKIILPKDIAALLMPRSHALGIKNASHDVVANSRQVLHAPAANHHHRVLLQIMPFARNVGRDLHAVRETDASDLPKR